MSRPDCGYRPVRALAEPGPGVVRADPATRLERGVRPIAPGPPGRSATERMHAHAARRRAGGERECCGRFPPSPQIGRGAEWGETERNWGDTETRHWAYLPAAQAAPALTDLRALRFHTFFVETQAKFTTLCGIVQIYFWT